MSGYGLSSDLIAGTGVLSKFIASVDQFAVVAPNRTAGQLNSVPFAVLTTSQTINGVSFAPGVYIDGASINSGTIGTAQIANAAIDTAKIADASIVTAKIGDAQINSAKIQDAAIITAKINDAAITTAKINDASIVTAKINDAAITTAKIGTAQITTALISNAAITNAKIGDAQIDTLKVAGNSITVSASATATLAYTASTSVALSFVQAPQSVVLLVRVSTDLASSASATAPTVTLKRNGTTIASRTVSPVVVSEYYSLSPVATGYDVVWLVYDTPPTAGTFTYTFANDGGGPSSRTVYIDILALGTMR